MENLFKYFILVLACVQSVTGAVELAAPVKAYRYWRGWINNRFFPVHGIILMAGGFPLTIYSGYLSGILFFIGLFIVLTGPFILLYPEKIRKAFDEAEIDLTEGGIRKLIYFDSVMRIGFAVILFLSYHRTFVVA